MTALLYSNGQLARNITKIELLHRYFYGNFKKVSEQLFFLTPLGSCFCLLQPLFKKQLTNGCKS